MSREERKAMIAPDHPDLSVSHQCKLLSISRSSFYYAPMGDSPEKICSTWRTSSHHDDLLLTPVKCVSAHREDLTVVSQHGEER